MLNKSPFKAPGKRLAARRKLPEITNAVGVVSLLELPDGEFEAAVKQLLNSHFFSLADVALIRSLREEQEE